MTDSAGFFAGRTALVTGAGQGIGRAIALALAEAGARVVLAGRDAAALEALAAQAPDRTVCLPTDLILDDDMEALATALEGGGRLDILVHSAGVFRMGAVKATPVEDLDTLYRINLRAPYLLTRRLLPLLKASKGHVVFINSLACFKESPNCVAYAATKAALKALADGLRMELNPHRVRVLSVYPGRTATPMQKDIHEAEGRPYRPGRLLQPETVADNVLHALMLPDTAELTNLMIRPMRKA